MSLKSRWLAAAVSVTSFFVVAADLAFAQPAGNYAGEYPTVTRVTPDASGNFVLLNVQGKQPLPVPVVQFLPGVDGQTIMCVDFHGTRFTEGTRVFQPSIPEFSSVRFGQFQADPPVFRISITTSNPALLRKIDFRSGQGNLIVLFPGHSTTATAAIPQRKPAPRIVSQSPPPASPVVPGSGERNFSRPPMKVWGEGTTLRPVSPPSPVEMQTAPPAVALSSEPAAAPDFRRDGKLPTMPAPAPQASEKKPPLPSPEVTRTPAAPDAAPGVTPESAVLSAPFDPVKKKAQRPFLKHSLSDASCGTSGVYAENPNAVPPPDSPPAQGKVQLPVKDCPGSAVSVSREGGAVKISLPLTGSYKAFSLGDPARFVVDLERGLPAGTQTVVPSGAGPVSQVRFGTPDSEGNLTRVVIDLTGQPSVRCEPAREGGALDVIVADTLVAGRTVVLDAGHGGTDPGAQRGDISEKDLTLAITAKLRNALEAKGLKVVMTRADDSYVGLEDRVKVTNEVKPDAFVSVHINSLETNSAITGVETYYQTDQSRALAASVHESLVKGLEVPDRNVRKARFYVVNHTPHPAILAEVGFISNKQERDRLISSEYQSKIAESISQGIISYLTTNQTVQVPASANQAAQARPVSFPETVKTGAYDVGKKKVAQN